MSIIQFKMIGYSDLYKGQVPYRLRYATWPEVSEFLPGTRARGYKTFSMLNSTEHEIFPAHKC